jgi:hypothetical protein
MWIHQNERTMRSISRFGGLADESAPLLRSVVEKDREVTCLVDKGQQQNSTRADAIDEAVIADAQLSYGSVAEFRDTTTSIRQGLQ